MELIKIELRLANKPQIKLSQTKKNRITLRSRKNKRKKKSKKKERSLKMIRSLKNRRSQRFLNLKCLKLRSLHLKCLRLRSLKLIYQSHLVSLIMIRPNQRELQVKIHHLLKVKFLDLITKEKMVQIRKLKAAQQEVKLQQQVEEIILTKKKVAHQEVRLQLQLVVMIKLKEVQLVDRLLPQQVVMKMLVEDLTEAQKLQLMVAMINQKVALLGVQRHQLQVDLIQRKLMDQHLIISRMKNQAP